MGKLYYGVVCGHNDAVVKDDDAYCVECSDGVVDVCIACGNTLIDLGIVHNADTLNESDKPIYDGNVTSYWIDGSVDDLTKHILYFN